MISFCSATSRVSFNTTWISRVSRPTLRKIKFTLIWKNKNITTEQIKFFTKTKKNTNNEGFFSFCVYFYEYILYILLKLLYKCSKNVFLLKKQHFVHFNLHHSILASCCYCKLSCLYKIKMTYKIKVYMFLAILNSGLFFSKYCILLFNTSFKWSFNWTII